VQSRAIGKPHVGIRRRVVESPPCCRNQTLGEPAHRLLVGESHVHRFGAVTAVDPRGPSSGVLEEGDVLLLIDSQPVTFERLRNLEGRLGAGRSVLIIQRGNARFAIKL